MHHLLLCTNVSLECQGPVIYYHNYTFPHLPVRIYTAQGPTLETCNQ